MKTLWRSNSLSRSVFSTEGSFGTVRRAKAGVGGWACVKFGPVG